MQAGPDGTPLSESPIPLASLLNRTTSQTKAMPTGIGQSDSLRQSLWSKRVAAPEQGKEVEASLALKRLIRHVRSVKFEEKDTGPTFQPPAESLPSEEIVETQPVEVAPVEPTISASAPPAATVVGASMLSKTQRTLEVLQRNPDQVEDPLEVAELLFLSGRPVEAIPFYTKALDDISPSDPAGEADRAWVLFQLGNCLRETDIAKAQEIYLKLVSEYPASPWTELAKAHGRLLTWYQKSRSPQAPVAPQL